MYVIDNKRFCFPGKKNKDADESTKYLHVNMKYFILTQCLILPNITSNGPI